MTEAPVATDTRGFYGHNRVTLRAIRAVVSAITADELDTPVRTVGVELGDDGGVLTVTATAPIGVPSLVRFTRSAPLGLSAQQSVLERAGAAQEAIRNQVLALTGSAIGIVNLRLTFARIEGEERVR